MPWRTLIGRSSLIAVGVAALALLLAPQAGAYLYFGEYADAGDNYVGRANLDGGGLDETFILAGGHVCGVAVDATYVYWTRENGAIGRASLDGTGVNQSFITGLTEPCGIAVNATSIYWANRGTDSIGTANLDGTNSNPALISTGADSAPCGVALDAGFVYWGQNVGGFGYGVGRAALGSTTPEMLTTAASGKCGVAVDADHVYWTNADLDGRIATSAPDSIGRMDKTSPPSNVNDSFITGATNPCGVAVNATNVYWANYNYGSIGRAGIDGSGAQPFFIPASFASPCGIAVDPGGPTASPPLSLGRVTRDRSKGTAELVVNVPEGGDLLLSGNSVKTERATTTGPTELTLPVRAKGAAKRKLAKRGKATVRFTVTLKADNREPRSADGSAKLIRKQ